MHFFSIRRKRKYSGRFYNMSSMSHGEQITVCIGGSQRCKTCYLLKIQFTFKVMISRSLRIISIGILNLISITRLGFSSSRRVCHLPSLAIARLGKEEECVSKGLMLNEYLILVHSTFENGEQICYSDRFGLFVCL